MRKNGRTFFAGFLALTLLLGLTSAFAAGEDTPAAENYDGYIVKFKEDSGPIIRPFGAGGDALTPVGNVEGLYTANTAEAAAPYLSAGLVEYMEPNYYVELLEPYVQPDDYDESDDWNLKMIDMPYIWEHGADYMPGGLTGAGVRVAVIDSGIRATHEDFEGAHIEAGKNYTFEADGQLEDDVTDSYGHGTFVSGIIAAQGNNGKGTIGVAPDVTIVPLRVFYAVDGGTQTSTTANVIAAINDAVTLFDCDVINMSLGIRFTGAPSTSLTKAVDDAIAAGCILIAAAGNSGNSTLYYPAAYDNVISVGAVDSTGAVWASSQRNDKINVVAPGAGVHGLYATSDSAYATGSGTSYAAPHVAALAALARQVDRGIEQAAFMALVVSTTKPVTPGEHDAYAGSGIVNAERLIQALPGVLVLTRSADHVEIEARFWGLAEDDEYHIVAAAYDGAGRMLDCVYEAWTVLATGHLPAIQTQFAADVEIVRVFLLEDGTFAAVLPPLEQSPPEQTPPGEQTPES